VSQTVDEAYGVIERGARLLFPGLSGALFVLPPSRLIVERVATWGHVSSARTVYGPEDCWAIRQGRLHIVEGAAGGPRCRHVDDAASSSWMCIPMTAQGSMIGILHLSGEPAPARPGLAGANAWDDAARSGHGAGDAHLPDAARNLALWVAELLGLSLANFRLRETLQTQSTRDPLTGLFNRRYMEESLERELYRAAREHGTLGTIMLDLDHFKELNDRAGHVAGDEILREIAKLLRTHVRAEDIVCRYGGEEFTILLPDAGRDETQARADALRRAVDTMELSNRQRVTISAGVAVYPANGTTAEELVDAADSALYAAKAAGRNRVVAAA
jgi:diguanylate cyclase (GGDEF)-like protein